MEAAQSLTVACNVGRCNGNAEDVAAWDGDNKDEGVVAAEASALRWPLRVSGVAKTCRRGLFVAWLDVDSDDCDDHLI